MGKGCYTTLYAQYGCFIFKRYRQQCPQDFGPQPASAVLRAFLLVKIMQQSQCCGAEMVSGGIQCEVCGSNGLIEDVIVKTHTRTEGRDTKTVSAELEWIGPGVNVTFNTARTGDEGNADYPTDISFEGGQVSLTQKGDKVTLHIDGAWERDDFIDTLEFLLKELKWHSK